MVDDRRRARGRVPNVKLSDDGAVFVAAWVCIGGAGGLREPRAGASGPGGGAGGQLAGVVNVDNFEVPAGDQVGCQGHVTVRCNTANVAGQLLSQPANGAGQDGGSITIESEGDVTITGRVAAGDATAGAAETSGGKGGTVTVVSEGGNITVGGDGTTAEGTAGANGTSLEAGNGGNGGNGQLGGAGGEGGSIILDCENGTLTIHPGADLVHIGNGGHGGQAAMAGQNLQGVDLPEEMQNAGGDSGQLLLRADNYVGVEPREFPHPDDGTMVRMALLEGSTGSGGHGGDAGGVSITLDAVTGRSGLSERRAAKFTPPPDPDTVVGARGGNGTISGGGGADAEFDRSDQEAVWGGEWDNEPSTGAIGGEGGSVSTASVLGTFVLTFYPGDAYGGDGGHATARSRRGPSGGPCEPGKGGGAARASGGTGGGIFFPLAALDTLHPGTGGNAVAVAGRGGSAGDCCEPTPGDGQPGGDGGLTAAHGGPGGVASGAPGDPTKTGPGGDASATSGNGGNGGDGVPRGNKGFAGDVLASPGSGTPNGKKLLEKKGANGARGDHCTPPPPQPKIYTLFSQKSPAKTIRIYQQWLTYESTASTTSIGGANNPVELFAGQSIATTPDGGRLFACTRDGEVWGYNDPTTGGDRPPDVTLQIPNPNSAFERPQVWLDEVRDTLYCSMDVFIYAYHGASGIQSGAVPNRTIEIPNPGATRIPMSGDPTNDRLFAASGKVVHVFDNASGRNGAGAADRTFQPSNRYLLGIAYDAQRDLVYVCQNDNYPGGVSVIADASSADGAITPVRVLAGKATGIVTNELEGCAVFPDDDLLFVAQGGFLAETRVMVWEKASQVDGNLAPLQSGATAHAFGIWREP